MSGDRVGQPAKGSLEWHENKQQEQASETGNFQIKSGPAGEGAIPQSYEDGAAKSAAPAAPQNSERDNKVYYGSGAAEDIYNLEELENKH